MIHRTHSHYSTRVLGCDHSPLVTFSGIWWRGGALVESCGKGVAMTSSKILIRKIMVLSKRGKIRSKYAAISKSIEKYPKLWY